MGPWSTVRNGKSLNVPEVFAMRSLIFALMVSGSTVLTYACGQAKSTEQTQSAVSNTTVTLSPAESGRIRSILKVFRKGTEHANRMNSDSKQAAYGVWRAETLKSLTAVVGADRAEKLLLAEENAK